MRPLPGKKLVGTRIAGDKREIGHGIFLSVLTDPVTAPWGRVSLQWRNQTSAAAKSANTDSSVLR
jgi:hypothetical protein